MLRRHSTPSPIVLSRNVEKRVAWRHWRRRRLHQLHRGDFEVEIKWTYAAFISKSGIKRIFICRKQSLNISQTRNLEFLWLLFNHLSRKQKGKGEFSMYWETTATTTTTNDVRLQFKSVYCVKTIAEMGIMRWFLVTRHLKRKWATFSHVSILSLTISSGLIKSWGNNLRANPPIMESEASWEGTRKWAAKPLALEWILMTLPNGELSRRLLRKRTTDHSTVYVHTYLPVKSFNKWFRIE